MAERSGDIREAIHLEFMREAMHEARKAYRMREVPIGAVIVKDGEIIARGHNMREHSRSPFAHAEMYALMRASKRTGWWNLHGCSIYVTLEPCMMCMGAIIMSNIKRVYYAAQDKKRGCLSSELRCDVQGKVDVVCGIMQSESSALLKKFFARLRDANAARQRERRLLRDSDS